MFMQRSHDHVTRQHYLGDLKLESDEPSFMRENDNSCGYDQ